MKNLIIIILLLCTFRFDYETDEKCKVIVEYEGQVNTYDYEQGTYYPMLYGEGEYNIYLYENISGTKYKKVLEYSYQLLDDSSPFTKSVLGITPETYKALTESITSGYFDRKKQVVIIADYVIDTLDYDLNCLEYSEMFASMCRSLNIECKVCKGYYNEGIYHAWNEVYVNGEWLTVDLVRTEEDGVIFRSGNGYNKLKEY